jgi:hypothetical protein
MLSYSGRDVLLILIISIAFTVHCAIFYRYIDSVVDAFQELTTSFERQMYQSVPTTNLGTGTRYQRGSTKQPRALVSAHSGTSPCLRRPNESRNHICHTSSISIFQRELRFPKIGGST